MSTAVARAAAGRDRRVHQRGADSAAGVEHIVADDHIAALDVDADCAWGYHRAHICGRQIVAVELDVEHAGVHCALLDAGDQPAQPLGQRNAAALDADQARFVLPLLFSTISWARRTSVRSTSEADISLPLMRREGLLSASLMDVLLPGCRSQPLAG